MCNMNYEQGRACTCQPEPRYTVRQILVPLAGLYVAVAAVVGLIAYLRP